MSLKKYQLIDRSLYRCLAFAVIFYVNCVFGQSNNYWTTGLSYYGLNFTSNTINKDESIKFNKGVYPTNSICNSKGQLQLIHVRDGLKVYLVDNKGNKIHNSQTKMDNYTDNWFLSFGKNRYVYLYCYDSSGINEKRLVLNNVRRFNDGVHFMSIVFQKDRYNVLKKDTNYIPMNATNFTFSRINDTTYAMICNSTDKLISAFVYWDRIVIKDTLNLVRYSNLPDSLKNNPKVSNEFISRVDIAHNSNFVIATECNIANFQIPAGTPYYYTYGFGCAAYLVRKIQYNKLTGKFGFSSVIESHLVDYTKVDFVNLYDCIISPDSKKMIAYKIAERYAREYTWYEFYDMDLNNFNVYNKMIKLHEVQQERSRNDSFTKLCFRPKLSPQGDCVFALMDYKEKKKSCNIVFNSFKKLNLGVNGGYQLNSSILTTPLYASDPDSSTWDFSFDLSAKHVYDFLKVKLQEVDPLNCKARIKYANTSDTSIQFSLYKVVLYEPNGVTDTFKIGHGNGFIYTSIDRNGDIPVKIIGLTTDGYSEVIEDTLRFRNLKPEIKSVDFVKTICAYHTYEMKINLEYNDNLTKVDYRVDFYNSLQFYYGNWTQSSFKYRFNEKGMHPFRVRVNSIMNTCSDTFLDTITVLDAPKPGFRSDEFKGCSPLKVTFNDTAAKNYLRKSYWFSDSSKWVDVPVNQYEFSHTFKKSGYFIIAQKLSNTTACVTQTDTIKLLVLPGLTNDDSVKMMQSTVENPNFENQNELKLKHLDNNPKLLWKKLPNIDNYKVYKNGLYITSAIGDRIVLNDYYDTSAYYTVKGVDVCKSESASKNGGKPILLKGEVTTNNKSARLSYSSYEPKPNFEVNYTLQHFINGQWIDQVSSNDTGQLTVDEHMQQGRLESCYRIVGQSLIDTGFHTYSNIVCLPYMPVIYLPNSFSPNGDQINDILEPLGYGILDFKMSVYNRWGELIFSGSNSQPWNGSDATDGIYTVTLEYTTVLGEKLKQRQNVHLLK